MGELPLIVYGDVVFSVAAETKQNQCCWCGKRTKAMLLMTEQNKSQVDSNCKKTVSFIQQFVEAHSQSYLKEVI